MCAQLDYRANLHRRAVSRAIRAWREARGMSGNELAIVLKADSAERDRALQSVRLTTASASPDGGLCLEWSIAHLETEAHELRMVAVDVVPPLLQTRAYSEAVWAAKPAAVRQRHKRYDDELRQATLAKLGERPNTRLHVVLSEAVLRRAVGRPEITADQLLRLVWLAELSNVTLQVVPDANGVCAGSSFTILSFLEDRFDDVVYAEQLHAVTWLEAANERVPYEETFAAMARSALESEESLELILTFASQPAP